MPVEDFNLAELLQTSLISFDAECWEFSFLRTIPVAIFIDAGDNSSDLGPDIVTLVEEVLKESGFDEFESLSTAYGSFLSLNLSKSPVPLDGSSFGEKLAGAKDRLVERLRKYPWGEAAKVSGSVVKVAVAIGTTVVILSALPAAPLVIGSFVVPAKVWMLITAAGQGVTMVEEANNIFVHSKAAVRALNPAEQATTSAAPAAKREEITAESMSVTEERLKELENEVRGFRNRLLHMKKP